MRVTNKMIFDQANSQTQMARARHQEAISQASSGLRVSHPSDDPVAAGLIAKHRLAEARQDAISQGLSRAQTEVAAADSAMGDVANLLIRAKELTLQMSNATYSANDRSLAAVEVDELMRGAISSLNTEVAGRYIFGGAKDGSPPFNLAGNYLGDATIRQIEIAPGVLSDASIRADVAMKGTGGGIDVLSLLKDLSQALRNNDTAGMSNALGTLSHALVQVSSARTQLGTLMNVMQTAHGVSQVAKDAETASISREADIEPTEAFSNLARAETSLEASLTAVSKSFKMSLIDKL